MKKLLCVALLFFAQQLSAFTFTNFSQYPVEVHYAPTSWWFWSLSTSVSPYELKFRSPDTIEDNYYIHYRVVVYDTARNKTRTWILRSENGLSYRADSSFTLYNTRSELVLFVNGIRYL